MNPLTPPKGSLEDLFRHHLLESEAAAVPPRPQVWEQLDNRLLLAQNEKYRRRLATYRWAVAASLLLASLAGGGWWHSQQAGAPAAPLAHALPAAASRPGLVAVRRAAGPATLASVALPGTAAGQPAAAITSSSLSPSLAIDQTTTPSALGHPANAHSLAYLPRVSHRRAALSTAVAQAMVAATSFGSDAPAVRAQVAAQLATGEQLGSQRAATEFSTTPLVANSNTNSVAPTALALTDMRSTGPTTGQALRTSEVSEESSTDAYALATAAPTNGEASLATRWASLAAGLPAALPTSLAAVTVAAGPPLELARNWQYGGSYTVSAFRPNIDFSKAADAYNTAFGLNSPIITRSAAAEYRNNLHTGLGQRLSLWATRRLGASRWSLRTGLELTQSTAASASSVAFVGEQVADLAYSQAAVYAPAPTRLQRTSYRYRSVSVPVEARYANPVKTGFSFYGRVGAFVSALLNAHSEVEDNPEAARTYTPASTSSPYRHLSMGVRGGGGLQYRPAGHQWAFNLGPVAELGVLSLNADPSQGFLTQQRPYSFGLEAGVELGRGFKIQ